MIVSEAVVHFEERLNTRHVETSGGLRVALKEVLLLDNAGRGEKNV